MKLRLPKRRHDRRQDIEQRLAAIAELTVLWRDAVRPKLEAEIQSLKEGSSGQADRVIATAFLNTTERILTTDVIKWAAQVDKAEKAVSRKA
jgi:hypothetical protein